MDDFNKKDCSKINDLDVIKEQRKIMTNVILNYLSVRKGVNTLIVKSLKILKRHRVRVVKETDLKSVGLCPRRFNSCRCRKI